MNINDVVRQLMNTKDHVVKTNFGEIRGRITEVGGDKTGMFVSSGGSLLYVKRYDGTDVNPRFDGKSVTIN